MFRYVLACLGIAVAVLWIGWHPANASDGSKAEGGAFLEPMGVDSAGRKYFYGMTTCDGPCMIAHDPSFVISCDPGTTNNCSLVSAVQKVKPADMVIDLKGHDPVIIRNFPSCETVKVLLLASPSVEHVTCEVSPL